MSKPKKQVRTRKELAVEKRRLAEVEHRYLSPNLKARKFCWSHGLTIYAAAQKNLKVKLFVHKGEKFKPLSEIEYDQYDEQEVMEYHAAIDAEYERIYKLKKDVEKKS